MKLFILIATILFSADVGAQDFLNTYHSYLKSNHFKDADSIVTFLDSCFKSYKAKEHFDFNEAKTINALGIKYDKGVSHWAIWSGKDTLNCKEEFDFTVSLPRKEMVNDRFFGTDNSEYIIIDERDTIASLISNSQFEKLNQFIRAHRNNSSLYSYLYVHASFENGKYKIRAGTIPPFSFDPIWRKRKHVK